jgi:hypothetical protein
MPRSAQASRVLDGKVLTTLIKATAEGFFHIDRLTNPRLGVGERTTAVDRVLLRRLNMSSCCSQCKRQLPVEHRYTLCEGCAARTHKSKNPWRTTQ